MKIRLQKLIPGDVTGGVAIFVIMFGISIAELYLFRKSERAFAANDCACGEKDTIIDCVRKQGTCAGGGGSTGKPIVLGGKEEPKSKPGTPSSKACGGCDGKGGMIQNLGCEAGKLSCEFSSSVGGTFSKIFANCIPGLPIPCVVIAILGIIGFIIFRKVS